MLITSLTRRFILLEHSKADSYFFDSPQVSTSGEVRDKQQDIVNYIILGSPKLRLCWQDRVVYGLWLRISFPSHV